MKTIIVIEDENDLKNELYDTLTFEGFNTIVADNGDEGLEACLQTLPDLILCDIKMQGINGFEVIKQIKAHSSLVLVPFIFITAIDDISHQRKAMNLGADDFLVKPFSQKDLLQSIEARLIRSKQIKAFLERIQSNILNYLPHEFNTALNVIMGFSKILMEEDPNLVKSDRLEMVGSIHDSGKTIHKIVSKLLTSLEIDYKKHNITFRYQSLKNNQIKNLANAVAQKYERREDLKIADEDFDFFGKKEWIIMTIEELLDNAFKFSTKGNPVTVKFIKSQNRSAIRITNRGSDFPKETKNALDIFSQFTREQMKQQGIGFGLHITKKIVDVHKGFLHIESNSAMKETAVTAIFLNECKKIQPVSSRSFIASSLI
jgi:DNA-binding response OmpR family regulator/anti-sigma regulatory factor (Ser/Thr protein kinase)